MAFQRRLESVDKGVGAFCPQRIEMENHELDCCGLPCPMPIVRISQAMNGLLAGEVLKVQADDPAFRADVEAWVKMTGNEILSMEEGPVTTANLKRSA